MTASVAGAVEQVARHVRTSSGVTASTRASRSSMPAAVAVQLALADAGHARSRCPPGRGRSRRGPGPCRARSPRRSGRARRPAAARRRQTSSTVSTLSGRQPGVDAEECRRRRSPGRTSRPSRPGRASRGPPGTAGCSCRRRGRC